MSKTIFFTGGHHNSALQVALKLKQAGYNLIWLGHQYNISDKKTLSAEYQEVTSSNIKFINLTTGRFYQKFNLVEFFKLIKGFFISLRLILKYKPSLVFSSGGFMSVPVVISAYCLGVKSFTHEQTVVSGWANKAIGPFVKKILLTHASSAQNYPAKKTEFVGLPLSEEILNPKNTKTFKPKLLYITCGKQGSHLINSNIFPIIVKLVKSYTVVHQVGANQNTDDFVRAAELKKSLGNLSSRYIYSPYFFAKESATYLRSADIVIARSGAHTIYELITLRKKAILIPITWVSHNEQVQNATLAKNEIGSLILDEKKLDPNQILESIESVEKKPSLPPPAKLKSNATERILEIITQEIGLP